MVADDGRERQLCPCGTLIAFIATPWPENKTTTTLNTILYKPVRMPINADRFEHLDEDGITLAEGTNAHEIMTFLVARPNEAFRQSELVEQTDVTSGSIGPTLQRLRERGLVRHRQNYWALGHEERLGQVTGLKSTFAAINRHYEPETRDDWFGHDV
jgi:hypothetical protein